MIRDETFDRYLIPDMQDWGPGGSREISQKPTVGWFGWRQIPFMKRGVLPGSFNEWRMQYLRRYLGERLGLDQIRPTLVDSTDLFQGIRQSPRARKELETHLSNGGTVEFFHMNRRAKIFMEEFGISQEKCLSSPMEVVWLYDDKLRDRRNSVKLGLPNIYTPWLGTVTSLLEAEDLCQEMFDQGYKKLIVRRPDLASGAGMKRFSQVDLESRKVHTFIVEMERMGAPALLVEECLEEFSEFSVSFWISSPDKFRLLCVTKQYTQAGDHLGNLVGPNAEGCRPDGVSPQDWILGLAEDLPKLEMHTRQIAADGGKGVVCFDGLWDLRSGRRVYTEKNIRRCAGSENADAREALAARWVCSRNVGLREEQSFWKVEEALAGEGLSLASNLRSLSGRGEGIVILNPHTQDLHPMWTALACADSPTRAEEMLDATVMLFEGRNERPYFQRPLRLAASA